MEYLIDNATTDPTGLVGKAIVTATSTTVALETTIGSATADTPINYIDRTADAAKAKADAASNKQVAGIQGAYYDDAKAAKALNAVLMAVYNGTTYKQPRLLAQMLYILHMLSLLPERRLNLRLQKITLR